MPKPSTNNLKKVCKLAGVKYAAWIARGNERWEIIQDFGLNQNKRRALHLWLSNGKIAAWLAGAIANERMRSRKVGSAAADLGFIQVYLFPNREKQSTLLVGANLLEKEQKAILQVFAGFGPEQGWQSDLDLDSRILFRHLETGAEPAYDLQGVLEQVLSYLIEAVSAAGGWIALRSGNVFVIRATQADLSKLLGREIDLEHTPRLQEMVDTYQGWFEVSEVGAVPFPIPIDAAEHKTAWLSVPIVVGQRVIGLAVFWHSKAHKFNEADMHRAINFAGRSAHLIENAIIFSEAARYLQQLALVNELATAAASGSDIDEVAERVLSRLRRVFTGAHASLLVLSSDGNWLLEYGIPENSGVEEGKRISIEGTLPGYVVKNEKPFNLVAPDQVPPGLQISADTRSELAVPLRYRGRVIGTLVLSSSDMGSFSRQDEQLLVMIAGHMAGLLENVRLNDEMRKRAQNLSLIHEVVQKVVGLTDPAQIAQAAAAMMAEQFDYDVAQILLTHESQRKLVLTGIAGRVEVTADFRIHFPVNQGVIGKVFQDGASRVVEDLSRLKSPHPVTGMREGSEICVLLQGGDQPLGVIDAVRQRPFAFTENDLLALEALAGVLSSVFSNADRYQELQTSVRQLEAARVTGLEIAGDLDLDILLRRVVRRARELIGARGAELALVDEQAEIVRTVVSDNPWRDFTGTEVPFMSGVEGKVAVLGEPLVVSDYNNWSGRLYPERHMPYRMVAGIPLQLKGKVIGVLLVSDDRPEREFRADDLQLLEFFAAQAAVFIRNARLYQEIQDRMEAQRQAEMQLIRSARLAAVGEMAAGVAHELNNPLTTVAGFIELVLEELPEGMSQRQDLELVMREAKRARGVVRRLLDFSRPGDNIRVSTDLNELVSEVLTLVQHLIRTNGVELRVQLREDLPWIPVDPNQIKQVLLNLVHNALQAMPRGGVLSVTTEPAERDGVKWLTVAVEDSGAGIVPEDLERIFEPFFTTRPVGSGTGLGLSVSYGIITEHGGFIEVDSVPGEGSCFTVWLQVEPNG